MPKPGVHAARIAPAPSRELLQARKLSPAEHASDAPTSARYRVFCPMVRTEVVLQRCDFCPHGKEWVHDQVTDTVMLRCSFLARDE